jgi:hypothetical protein
MTQRLHPCAVASIALVVILALSLVGCDHATKIADTSLSTNADDKREMFRIRHHYAQASHSPRI